MGGRTRNDPKSKSSRSSRSQATSKPSTTSESTSKTVPTIDSNFPRLAFENGILDPVSSKPPANLESRQESIDRSRDTASPSESYYRKFAYKIRTACNKQTILLQTSQLLKEYDEADSGYSKVYNQAFTAFPKNVGFNNGLSAAQPDMVEALNIGEFDPFPVRQELGGAAVPTSGPHATTLQHFAGEWKGPGKDMIEAQTQAGYDGSCMVYSRNEARLFLESPDPANHAFFSTFTTDGTTLNIFDHYLSKSQGQVKYHQYPTSSSFLISSYKEFKKSRRWLRNIEDDAKATSEKLRDELNEKWSANHRSPAALSVPVQAADSTDYNNYDYDDEEDPNNQLLAEYRTSFPTNDQYDSGQIPTTDNIHQDDFPANDEDDPFIQVPTTNNEYTSLNSLTFPLVTPPQSLEDTSLPLKSSEDIDRSNGRGHRGTRQTRKPVVIVDARKTRRRH